MNDETRFSLPGDEPELMALWRDVFHHPDDVTGMFFEKLYSPGMAAVYIHDGAIVSAAYILRLGDLVSGGRWTPCRLVYAWGTHPGHRGKGYGGRVLSAASEAAARSGVGVICPTESGLFTYCEKIGFRPMFGASAQSCVDVGLPLTGSAARVTVRGYAALREELLNGTEHIDFDIKALEYRQAMCDASGGGLFYLVSDRIRCCAAVELRDGAANILELVVPSGSVYNAAALAARAVGAERFTYRAPVRSGDQASPFAMVYSKDPINAPGNAWFGPQLP